MLKLIAAGFMLLVYALLIGCQEKREQALVPTAVVEANQPYLQYFGEPPAVQSGQGYARVAYLPLRNDPDHLRAIPLYLFSDEDPVQSVLTRLVDGSLSLPPGHPLFVPFVAGTSVVVNRLQDGLLEVELVLPAPLAESDMQAGLGALVETASQFPQVRQVIIRVDGIALPSMPQDGFTSRPDRIIDVAPPALVMVAGMWEPGGEQPEEILINFDRPVTVERCEVFDSAGEEIAGEYFVSTFRMSVVIHPEKPASLQAGTLLTVLWHVTDALDRSASGRTTLPLQRFDH